MYCDQGGVDKEAGAAAGEGRAAEMYKSSNLEICKYIDIISKGN